MIKITIDRQSVKEKDYKIKSIEQWEDVNNDISEQKFLDEFAKMFVEINPGRGKPDVLAV